MFTLREKYPSQKELDAERVGSSVPEVPTLSGEPPAGPARLQEGDDGVYVPRDPEIRGGADEPSEKVEMFRSGQVTEPDAPVSEVLRRRHSILMASLDEEGERQAEERQQAQIDDDYYHHQQWRPDEAQVLMARGQAPLVFNESRGAIDWMCGTERHMRKDYKIRPRSPEDEQNAEFKTKAFKYVEDANLSPWHRSRAFKQMATSGLGWLEEGVNTDPEGELIFTGSEDWRRVFRDSRGREFDCDDWRYIHRRKILDLDYAVCLLPKATAHLNAIAGRWGMDDEEQDDIWYLGMKLTSAHAAGLGMAVNGQIFTDEYTVRRAGSALWDHGRRQSVELLETWYRVPERVEVFNSGPYFRQVFNPTHPGHVQAKNDRYRCYEAVKMRMRVMVGTKYQPCWDGPSPYSHGKFPLIPMWGYRRDRDGMVYGAMRGMRDPQDDLNKRRSKALFALSAIRVTFQKGAFEDPEIARQEYGRVDAMVEVDGDVNQVKVDKFMGEVQGNMELAVADIEAIRNIGGVTGENLGHETSSQSGKAIIAKQQQGSMTTYELFDNYFLAFKMAGQLRLSNIEQFCNQEWQFRLDPQGARPPEWVTVNKLDPRTGQYLNDITAGVADFIVDAQDYRATLTQAAMDSMFDLLTKMATFAPQIVLNLLDLVVENSDVKGKQEWVDRIRKMTGQRDPSKAPTPEELAADQKNAAKQELVEQITIEKAMAEVDVLKSKITDTNAGAVMKNLQGLLSAIEAASMVITAPGIAPAADGLAKSAGFKDATPADTIVAQPEVTAPAQPLPVAPAADGTQQSPEQTGPGIPTAAAAA